MRMLPDPLLNTKPTFIWRVFLVYPTFGRILYGMFMFFMEEL